MSKPVRSPELPVHEFVQRSTERVLLQNLPVRKGVRWELPQVPVVGAGRLEQRYHEQRYHATTDGGVEQRYHATAGGGRHLGCRRQARVKERNGEIQERAR